VLHEQLGDLLQRGVRSDCDDVRAHQVPNLHGAIFAPSCPGSIGDPADRRCGELRCRQVEANGDNAGVLAETAHALVADGKAILAADESRGTIKRRFDAIGAESTEESRRAYRDLLFTADGAEQWISGVILFDETIRQKSADGAPFPQLLEAKGIIPGI